MSSKPLAAAAALSRLSKCRNRHGAVLVKNGQVIAAATNSRRGDTSDTAWRAAHVHAEEAVLSIAGNQAVGAILYVARTDKKGNVMLSAPCARCVSKITRARVLRVYAT